MQVNATGMLRDVAAPDSSLVIAVGDGGMIFMSRNGLPFVAQTPQVGKR